MLAESVVSSPLLDRCESSVTEAFDGLLLSDEMLWRPVAEAYCRCWEAPPVPPRRSSSRLKPPKPDCRCEEDHQNNEWQWKLPENESEEIRFGAFTAFTMDRREVTFHKVYSTGTAVIRGNTPLVADHHYYWEIKILTELYGTDVMIGVGTENVNVQSVAHRFTSFLGLDSDSYGFSYMGRIQHDGKIQQYGRKFGQGVIIGVHLDMWLGTLQFYINRKPMGIAFNGLKKHTVLFPMVSSTASQSAIRLIYSMSCPASLVYHCTKSLAQNPAAVETLRRIPGFKNFLQKAFWIFLQSRDDDNEYKNSDDEDNKYKYDETMSKLVPCASMFPSSKCVKINCRKMCPENRKNGNVLESSDESQTAGHGNTYKQLYENIDCDNSLSNTEVLKRLRMSRLNDDEANDQLWLAALESTTECKGRDDSLTESGESVIKFSTRLTSDTCEVCNSRLAVTIKNQKGQLNKCLECFYTT
ncbi:uncharacterized protein LOC143911137 [Arctopsyche grandis]|uniref:uncharacterized protein LOC143911137 n=1 Tax=Arctopsyche grandis TaxID=121162 RepID=UPI00406D78FD